MLRCGLDDGEPSGVEAASKQRKVKRLVKWLEKAARNAQGALAACKLKRLVKRLVKQLVKQIVKQIVKQLVKRTYRRSPTGRIRTRWRSKAACKVAIY